MAKLYLVLQHADVHRNGSVSTDGNVKHSGPWPNEHDSDCSCLSIRKQTFRTREEADQKAKELEGLYPGDFCWSLEVDVPE